MITGTSETSDETSSSCFPPKASIVEHAKGMSSSTLSTQHNGACKPSQSQLSIENEQYDMSCSKMWEGSCPDRQVTGRHPFSTKTTPQPLFAKTTDEVLPRSQSTGSAEEALGSGRSSARSAHDPFTSSQSSMASEHQQYAAALGSAIGQEDSRGGLAVAPTTTHSNTLAYSPEKGFPRGAQAPTKSTATTTTINTTTSYSNHNHQTAETVMSTDLQYTLDQHVPQLMKLLSESEGDSVVSPLPTTTTTTTTTKQQQFHVDPSNGAGPAFSKPPAATTSQHRSGKAKRAIPEHQPQFTLKSSATPFEPKQHVEAAGGGAITPHSSASCFSVTSFNEGEAPVNSPDTRNLQKAGCEFVATPFAVLKAEPTLVRLSPGEDNSVKEIFVGQLPFDFSPAALCDALRRLVGSQESIVTRFKMGPKPTCAFLTVKDEYEAQLLNLSKKILCDNNGMWVARSDVASAGLQSVSKRRVALKKPGIPQRPMVLESVNQVSHAPKVHHHRAPPTYNQHPVGGSFGGAHAQPFYPPQQIGIRQQFSGQHNAPAANNGMSVCLCGTRHVVAMTHSFGSCSMCARDLPSGVMVRRCPKCPGTDICTVCVAMANGAQHTQQHAAPKHQPRAHHSFTQQASASSHHQYSQRALMDEDHVIF